jgi:hypothetical protein
LASTPLEAFQYCVRGQRVPDVVLDALAAEAASEEGTRALFGELIEPLSDSFDPRLAEAYLDTFARLLERVAPELKAESLLRRHRALGRPTEKPRRVVVLSRVTLGADVAVVSPFLAAAAQVYPDAELLFAGNLKNYELFEKRVAHLPLRYGRTALLRDRVAVGLELAAQLDRPGTLVIDADSRISQLGLLPFGPPERYLFFPSRAYRPESSEPIAALACAFVKEMMGCETKPFIAPVETNWVPRTDVTISLGVGENPAKRVGGDFEKRLVQGLLDRGHSVMLDKGGGGEETARVEALELSCRGPLYTWQGSFAPFAEAIRTSRLYIGYDSAGQHVAAACGVRQITVFAGAPNGKFVERWRPWAPADRAALVQAGSL